MLTADILVGYNKNDNFTTYFNRTRMKKAKYIISTHHKESITYKNKIQASSPSTQRYCRPMKWLKMRLNRCDLQETNIAQWDGELCKCLYFTLYVQSFRLVIVTVAMTTSDVASMEQMEQLPPPQISKSYFSNLRKYVLAEIRGIMCWLNYIPSELLTISAL